MITKDTAIGSFCIMLASLSTPVFAQTLSVGDLIDKGGKPLTKEEMTALLSGASVSGTQTGTGAKYTNKFKEDGSIDGKALRANGQTVDVTGKWNMNDQGQQCWGLSAGSGPKFGGCWFWFSLENKYYASTSNDKSGTLSPREVTK